MDAQLSLLKTSTTPGMREACSRDEIKQVAHGGKRAGAGRKPLYSGVPQTPRQLQARWRFTTKWQALMSESHGHPAHQHKTALSILDVPGSKLWLVPWMRTYVACWRKPKRVLEICAGSAIVGLSLLSEGRVGSLVLCEKDPDYAAVWQTLFGPRTDYDWLLDHILTQSVLRAELKVWLDTPPVSTRECALKTIVKSWCYHRGRLSAGFGLLPQTPGPGGGASIATGWRPSRLVQLARSLRDLRRRVTIHAGCGLDVLDAHLDDTGAFIYADPPYKRAGKKLYRAFTYDMERLLRSAAQAKAHVLISYEDDPPTCQRAAALGLDVQAVSMRTAEAAGKQEVLISNRPLPPSAALTPASAEDETMGELFARGG